MKLGFLYRETMRGSYYALDAPTLERSIQFTIDVRVGDIAEFMRAKVARIDGELAMEGFADRVALEGTLAFRVLDERRLPYEFGFRGNDGNTYRFRGQRGLTVLAVRESMTEMPASVCDASGRELLRATMHFDVRADWKTWLRSFRMTYAGGGVAH